MKETLTHAVTRLQPEAWALAAGHCPVIMSDTRPGLEHEGKLIGIHAGLAQVGPLWDAISARVPSEFMRQTETTPPSFPRGALIGVARLVGVVRAIPLGVAAMAGRQWRQQFEMMRGRSVSTIVGEATADRLRQWWRSGSKWGFLLEEAVLLPEPIPMRGAGGVWCIPAQARLDGREIRARLRATGGCRWPDSHDLGDYIAIGVIGVIERARDDLPDLLADLYEARADLAAQTRLVEEHASANLELQADLRQTRSLSENLEIRLMETERARLLAAERAEKAEAELAELRGLAEAPVSAAPRKRMEDLRAIALRAVSELGAALDPSQTYLGPREWLAVRRLVEQGRGPLETLALLEVIDALTATLKAVIPHAEARAEDLDEATRARDAVEDAKAELESLEKVTRPAAQLEVWHTSAGTWTMRVVDRDEQRRRVVNFVGEWLSESDARAARRRLLLGKDVA